MSLRAASVLLWTAGIRNRIRRQLQRLRKPQYLVATIVGGFYFWSVFLRRVSFSSTRMDLDAQRIALIEAPILALSFVWAAGTWLFGAERAQLQFSEAEVQFLFPAPVSRRALLHYKLAKSLLRIAFSSVVSTFFIGRFAPNPVFFAVGSWFAFSTFALHLTGASFTRESLTQHGRFGWSRRLGTVAIVALVLGLLAAWTVRGAVPPPPDVIDLDAWGEWLDAVTHLAPLSWVLYPVRAPIRLALAQTGADFGRMLPGAAALMAVHYLWVISSDVAFEEASAAASEVRARRLEQRRATAGQRPISAPKGRFRLPLAPVGRPEVAVVWKNVLSARRTSGPMLIPALAIVGFTAAMASVGALGSGGAGWKLIASVGCAASALFLILLGPSALRMDLRQDLPQIDILRSLPLQGWQVVLAEVLSPGLLLAAAQWLLLGAALALSAGFSSERFPLGTRAAIALSVAFVGPAFSLAGLTVQNLAVLLFPGWVVLDRRQSRGIEAIGQRLLTTAGSLLVLIVGVLPAGAVGGVVWAVLWWGLGIGWPALPVASAAAAALLLVEVYIAVRGMGRLFERFDVSE